MAILEIFKLITLVLVIYISKCHSQVPPPIPTTRGCDCDISICDACDFGPTCTTVASGGAITGMNCIVVTADADSIRGTGGDDCIKVMGSTVGRISSLAGEDCIMIEDSTITDTISGDNDDDCIIVTSSTVQRTVGVNGDDTIIFRGSRIADITDTDQLISGITGNDCIQILDNENGPSIVGDVSGGVNNDCVEVANSQTNRVTGFDGDDFLDVRCSLIETISGGSGNDILYGSSITIRETAYLLFL